MTTKLHTYPEYRETGHQVLRRIPSDWQVIPLRRVAISRCDGPFGSSLKSSHYADNGVQVVRLQNIGHAEYRRTGPVFISPSYYETLGDHSVLPGDVLIAGLGDTKYPAGRACVAPDDIQPAMVKADCFRFRLMANISPKFAAYQLTATASDDAGFLSTGSTRQRTNLQTTSSRVIAFPSIETQATIVLFLNHVDRKIQRFIQAKRRLIEILQEQKQIEIQRILHRTNTSSQGKRSGIPWLPSIPDHWSTIPLHRAAASLQTGPFGSQLHASDYVAGGRPIVNPSNMKNGSIIPDPTVTVDEATAERLVQHVLHKHDIVFARRGEMGRCVLVTDKEEGWLCGTGGLRMRPRPGIFDPYFLLAILSTRGVAQFLQLKSVGTVMDNLNESILHTLILPLPPLIEQQTIVSQLKRTAADIESTIHRTESAVGLIREYRSRLIADVVTGKLDVRDAAERLLSDDDCIDSEDIPPDFDDADEADDESSELFAAVADEG